ncbi:MarR family winged helix-turn-helix transcriptional regulator [Nonomuraea sp. NPDC050663]|uniref:MarR family winged helix-turn-helix transcriptional regulator n=1 Tax=Nonomuraea sp. NPDC050663 TaxID=3364370 RepID=UPI0037A96219
METDLSELIHRIAHRLRHGYRHTLEPLGLSPGQGRALRVLAEAPEPLRMVQLAEALRIVPRSVTPVIDALEEAGLVRRQVDPANRRSTLLTLTDRGQEVYARVVEARKEAARELFSVLTPEQQARLKELLAIVEESPFTM